MSADEGESCSKCGANAPVGTEYCRACGASLRVAAPATSPPKPSSSGGNWSEAPAVKPLSAFQTSKSKVWVPLILGIAVIVAVVVIVSANSSSDDQNSAAGVADDGPAKASCSPERLRELAGEYVDLGNRTQSASAAVPDVLTPQEGARRIRIRFERETSKAQEIASDCVIVDDADSGEAVVQAVARLNAANTNLYTFLIAYLEDGDGTADGYGRRVDVSGNAIDGFNTAWEAFAEETGFSLNDNVSTLDESSETD